MRQKVKKDGTPISAKAIGHDTSELKALLKAAGNRKAFDEFEQNHPYDVPKIQHDLLLANGVRELSRILSMVKAIPNTDWERLKAYTIVVLSYTSDTRCRELRLCDVTDLNTENWILWMKHPKGEGSYGRPRPLYILPEGRWLILKYLKAREKKF